ncbi:predicted protein [Botrytis cinerea T4]|uniref:Uncharacterized protein n=1 Tax=Botryotinia fuckeliana (strain T4) TaxID=999810 RepID=G2Y221_BOTF4|nr:predicted protein [Botrytis cinerea T4]
MPDREIRAVETNVEKYRVVIEWLKSGKCIIESRYLRPETRNTV